MVTTIMHSPLGNINNLIPLLRGRLPGQLIIQYSNRCNADCPQCAMRRSGAIPRHTLSIDRTRQLIDAAAARGVRSLSLTGGEPLLFLDDIVTLINHATRAGIPYVRTGTNGYMFRNSDAPRFDASIRRIVEKLAATDLYTFWISLDSASPSNHERMRGLDGVVRGIEKALPIFHEYGIYPAVNLGINRATGLHESLPFLRKSTPEQFLQTFKEAFEQFYRFAADLGFTIANACYPMSGEQEGSAAGQVAASVYGAISSDDLVSFSTEEKSIIFRALFETIPKFRGALRIFSPRCSLYGLINKYANQQQALYPCRGGTDFFFADCRHGLIHPCGYLEGSSGELPELARRFGEVASCERCEWECFRDPSDLLGPFAELFSRPLRLIGKMARDPQFFKLLREDLSYFRACGYFNGRVAPHFQAIRRFQHPSPL